MFGCPRCGTRLQNALRPGRVEFVCAGCRGRMMGAALVRGLVDGATYGEFWRAAPSPSEGLGCPACCEPMSEMRVSASALEQPADGTQSVAMREPGASAIVIDLCRRCHVFWFDRGESQQLERARPRKRALPPTRREGVVPDFKPILREDDPLDEMDFGTSNPWRRLAHHLGVPVGHDGARVWLPVTTLSVALAILIGLLVSLAVPQIDQRLGLIPAEPLRLLGLPWLLGPLLQEGLLAGLLNLLFFVFLADNLEQFLGSLRLLSIVVLSALAAQASQLVFAQDRGAPMIGSDPLVTALAVFFGLSFYRVHLDFLLGLHRPWHVFSLSTPTIVLLWSLVTLVDMFSGASAQTLGAHLAAGAVGALAKWVFLDRTPGAAEVM